MPDMLKNDFRFWRWLINFWSLLFFAVIILDFQNPNMFGNILNVIATIYIAALAVYVSNKEFERWYNKHEGTHPGEIFVVIWSVIVVGLFIVDFVSQAGYEMPNAVISSYIAVLTILAVTRKSKQVYARHQQMRKRR